MAFIQQGFKLSQVNRGFALFISEGCGWDCDPATGVFSTYTGGKYCDFNNIWIFPVTAFTQGVSGEVRLTTNQTAKLVIV